MSAKLIRTILAGMLILGVQLPSASAIEQQPSRLVANVCVAIQCVHSDTETINQVQTCGGSGNVVAQVGDGNSANICTQNQTKSQQGR